MPPLFVLVPLLAPPASLGPGGPGGPHPSAEPVRRSAADSLQRLRTWTERGRRSRNGLDDDQVAELRDVLFDVQLLRDEEPERAGEIDLALLDLAGLRWTAGGRSPEGEESLEELSALGQDELERRFALEATDFAAWLAKEVLERPQTHPDERRLAAATLLRGRHVASTLPILLAAGRIETGPLRDAILAALVGWPDPAVYRFFLDSLREDGAGSGILAAHLEAVGATLGADELDTLRDLCGRLYVAESWRAAARARPLVRVLDAERAVPILIEALVTWLRRSEDGRGSRRIQNELLRELQRISGSSIGPHPERWNRWWTAVQEGRIQLPEDRAGEGAFVTSATFFGLQPVSDQLVFVVDRSASMEMSFGTAGRSRYEEAVDQLIAYLRQSGEDTRFAIVLFSGEGERWRSGLSDASERNLEDAERWLRREDPEGGTQLFEGVRSALRLDRQGRLRAEQVEVDTVVVLCDGATGEGPDWVLPWIRANNDEAQLVFHCVQIGSEGDGTLEALAAATGGDFLRRAR